MSLQNKVYDKRAYQKLLINYGKSYVSGLNIMNLHTKSENKNSDCYNYSSNTETNTNQFYTVALLLL